MGWYFAKSVSHELFLKIKKKKNKEKWKTKRKEERREIEGKEKAEED